MSPDRQGRGMQAAGLEACPIDAVLLQQTICWQLRRSRPREILDVLQGIRLRFLELAAVYLPTACSPRNAGLRGQASSSDHS